MPSALLSLNFYLEIAVFACFCSLGSRKLLTILLSFYLGIDLMMLPESVSHFIAFSIKVYDIHFQTFSVLGVLFVKL